MGSASTATAPADDDALAAISAGRIQLRYDVLSDVGTGRLVGLQAELVWDHPTRGALPAGEVWAAADRRMQHRPLRRWLLQRACDDTALLPGEVEVGIPLPLGLTDAETFAADVTDALTSSGLPAERLVLAFPEELLDRAPSALTPALRTLHGAGVRLSLTDYGLGTTLWGLLTRVPLNSVVVSLRTLGATGGLDRALRMLRGISDASAEVGVRTIIADVESTDVLARAGALGLLAMMGPLLPHGLTAAQAATLLQPEPTPA
jgi:EAL domain-containing protein (putative c-di-GMP-specific phosphodiesterase class I)